MRPRSLLVWTMGIGALLPVVLAVAGAPTPWRPDVGLVAHLSGLLAGYAAVLLVVLLSRAPVLERRVGSNFLIRVHARLGPLFVVLMLVHVVAAAAAWFGTHDDDVVTAMNDLLGLPGLAAAGIATLLFVGVAVCSIPWVRTRVTYEYWHMVHLTVYVAVVASLAHELAGPDLAGFPALQVAWTLMHFLALALAVRYRLLAPLELAWRHRLRVYAIVPEAHGVASITIRGRNLDELDAEAGQFFRWRFLTPATWRTAHPFSLSAVPVNGTFRITVKGVGEGSKLIQAIRPGTFVVPEGPSGALTARQRTRPSVLLIAGGVGIAPMRSLFDSLDFSTGELTLIYRASGPADVVFRHELEAISRRRGARLVWMVGPSSDPSLAMTAQTLLDVAPDLVERDVYLCASARFGQAVRDALRDAGHPRRLLHEEVFGS